MSNVLRKIRNHRAEIYINLVFILITVIVFADIRHHEFISLDDKSYILDNPYVQNGLTVDSIRWALSADLISNSHYSDFWIPLTLLSHLLTVHLFGMEPSGHHLMNLALHLLNVLLLFNVLRRMTGDLGSSAFVTALFAIHPLHVESVAWVIERKDVLSGLFWMLTLWAYQWYTQSPGISRYLVVVLAFVMGLMSKPMLITVPFVLLLLDYWPLGRISLQVLRKPNGIRAISKIVLEKIPLLILTGTTMVITYMTIKRSGGIVQLEEYSLWMRIGNAFVSYVSYIRKMIWPSDLAFFYPHPADTLSVWQAIGSAFLLSMVSIAVLWYLNKKPYLAVGWFWYLGTLVPVVGLVQGGQQAMADRYTYIPLIGLFMMIAWGVRDIVHRRWCQKPIVSVTAGILVLLFMISAWHQVRYWRNDITLSQQAIRVTKNNHLAHGMLGAAYGVRGETALAVEHLQEAKRIQPGHIPALINLGLVYRKMSRFDDAMKEYKTALRYDFKNAASHFNLGLVYQDLDRLDDAIKEYRFVQSINPEDAFSYNNLGNIYKTLG